MYVLDTNVVSELRKIRTNKADTNVVSWFSGQASTNLFISVVTIIEIEKGVLQKERSDKEQGKILRDWFENKVLPAFDERILPVDLKVARACASLHVPYPKSEGDALIAATALAYNMTVITRNVSDFDATGVKIINPWGN